MLNAAHRHDKLLRRYLVATRERAEAQLAGTTPARLQRLSVRERTLAAAVRRIRLRLGLPETFDPVSESARLGIAGKRPGARPDRSTDDAAPAERGVRPRVRPVPGPSPTRRASPPHRGGEARSLDATVNDVLRLARSGAVDADAKIIVRQSAADRRPFEVVGVSVTEDGRLQIDIRHDQSGTGHADAPGPTQAGASVEPFTLAPHVGRSDAAALAEEAKT